MHLASAQAVAGGGGGGPAPFLLKTYDMVDDTSTDEIVSWSPNRNGFVVWNPQEFARLLLPLYFKHNNFSSFIRQLNTYGFRKIDPERWEFANEDFVKDQRHLLKNIHRRKPIHSHSHPPSSAIDPERTAFEEEIEKLSHEKTALEATLLKFRQEQSAAKVQLEELNVRVGGMEQRQDNLLTFLEKAVRNPDFVEQLARRLESIDFSAYKKKRQLPNVDNSQLIAESSLVDNPSSFRPDFGNMFPQDLFNKLRLELSPAVSGIHLVSCSTESSNEDAGGPPRILSRGCPSYTHVRTGGLVYAPEMIELSDTGTSFTLKIDSPLSSKAGTSEGPKLQSFEHNLTSDEENDRHISFHLNLGLALSPLQERKNQRVARMPEIDHEIGKSPESRSNANGNEADFKVSSVNKTLSDADAAVPSSKEASSSNQGPQTVQVNDIFWEQFLTERPGSSDNEEACSSFRANPCAEQEERRSGHEMQRT